jgi:hypothetical protein
MVRYDGSINTALRSQKSWQASLGLDYNFPLWNGPGPPNHLKSIIRICGTLCLTTLTTCKLHYYGENMAKAYAVGMETRLFCNLVKMLKAGSALDHANEGKFNNDSYTDYYNAQGN